MNKKQKTRINLLSTTEIDELYSIPIFNKKDRELFFALSNSDYKLLDEYRTQKLKIYFILQLGYFRATQQFYNFKFDDVLEDVSYLINKYFIVPNLGEKPRTCSASFQHIKWEDAIL